MADAKPLWAKLGSFLLVHTAIGLLSSTPGLRAFKAFQGNKRAINPFTSFQGMQLQLD
jgi:hypothetical protein